MRHVRMLMLLLVLVSVVPSSAQDVSVLFDLGFSLASRDTGVTRIDRLRHELANWLDARPAHESYELLIASHRDRVERRTSEPVSAGELKEIVAVLAPWGTVELLPVLSRTVTLMNSDHLLVVTDGQDISAVVPTPVPELPDSIEVEILSIPAPGPGTIHHILASLSTQPVDRPIPDAGDAADQPQPSLPDASVGTHEARVDAPAAILFARRPEYRTGRGLTAPLAWILAIAILGLLFYTIRRETKFRRQRIYVKWNNRRPPVLVLDVRTPDDAQTLRLEEYPATIGPGNSALPHEITVRNEGKRFFLETGTPVRINGMERTEYELGRGDQFRAGSVRVFVDAVEKVPWKRPPQPEHRLLFALPAVATVFAVGLFWYSAPVSYAAVPIAEPAVPVQPEPVARLPEQEPLRAEEGSQTAWSRDPNAPEASDFRGTAREYAAPEELPAGPLDFLAIHAHPDDEALYFGSLLPRLRGLGMRGAVLVFTDGESGLDQYPWRGADGRYPSRRMSGTELADVRRIEAARAIGALGADYYLRLGLSNAPYSSVLDVVGVEAVLERWGGADQVHRTLLQIIEALQPEIIIAPDEPGPALEHFEHQAVGVAVRRALETLEAEGRSPVHTLIIGTDPRQADAYTGHPQKVIMDPWVPASDGRIPRVDQIHALLAHQTQRDATVVGIQARLMLQTDFFLVHTDNEDVIQRVFSTARVE
ncbi:MAG: PIG-L family deacetylase [Spirochaetaceae bacterium]|nr:MAG: PIG-L family deacetylase [Spirochaetaceae bacterium]